MNLVISGKNIDITEGLRSAIEEKIGKLERYFNDSTEVHVTLSTEKERQKIEVTIPMKGSMIRAEETSKDMYVSIDLVEEVIERQLRKYKNKLIDKEQTAAQLSKDFIDEDSYDEEYDDNYDEYESYDGDTEYAEDENMENGEYTEGNEDA